MGSSEPRPFSSFRSLTGPFRLDVTYSVEGRTYHRENINKYFPLFDYRVQAVFSFLSFEAAVAGSNHHGQGKYAPPPPPKDYLLSTIAKPCANTAESTKSINVIS
jgi:hypothetical protein